MPVFQLLARHQDLREQAASGQKAIGVRHVGIGKARQEPPQHDKPQHPGQKRYLPALPVQARYRQLSGAIAAAQPLMPAPDRYDNKHDLQAHVAIQTGVIKHDAVGGARNDREQPAPMRLTNIEPDGDDG